MTAAEALRDLIVAAVCVVLVAVWAEPLVQRRRVARPAGASTPRLLTRGQVRRAQAQLDAAYELAEQQAQSGHGWAMPSRGQILAAGRYGSHDDLGVSDEDWELEVALLEDALNHEERPPIVAEVEPGFFDAW